jgi:hypothetical protein
MNRCELQFLGGVERRLRSSDPKQLRRSAAAIQRQADDYAAIWPALSASFAADVARLLKAAEEKERVAGQNPA